jgi:hypothetical protein
MAVYRIVEPVEPEVVPGRRLARAPVIDGKVIGSTDILRTEAIKDDIGRSLTATVGSDGTVVLAEPTTRRVFFTGWVR